MIAQNTGNGIGADHRLPAVGFGQLIGNAAFTPGGMRGPERHNLGGNAGIRPGGMLRRRAGEVLKGGIPALVEAGFPVVERPPSDVGGATGEQHIAAGLPGFK